ncbi:OmpA family protein [Gallibacterium genomosp. 3]|uniref:OmpA family protein n=1 Tax=Gallibacterium genomosp. 3 TaxID=505345 RepID=UPI00080270B8|nr:OmpA family protein [Gallibacterium genomosp. 3]
MKKLFLVLIPFILLLSGCAGLDRVSLSSDTYFSTNSARLKPEAIPKISAIARRIAMNPLITKVLVAGNTDSVGDAAYNYKLSKDRAYSVASELISNGVSSNLIVVQGNGETQPVASNSTASGRAQNRRVDIIVTGALIF